MCRSCLASFWISLEWLTLRGCTFRVSAGGGACWDLVWWHPLSWSAFSSSWNSVLSVLAWCQTHPTVFFLLDWRLFFSLLCAESSFPPGSHVSKLPGFSPRPSLFLCVCPLLEWFRKLCKKCRAFGKAHVFISGPELPGTLQVFCSASSLSYFFNTSFHIHLKNLLSFLHIYDFFTKFFISFLNSEYVFKMVYSIIDLIFCTYISALFYFYYEILLRSKCFSF